jgi:phage baseplate assembly protein W
MATGYKGFSTKGKNFSNSFTITGFELAKQDLVNHFNMRKGEKLHNPNFGTIIWDALYNPMTQIQVDQIELDIQQIIAYDPRVSAQSIVVDEFEHGLLIQIELLYIPDQILENLLFEFSTSTDSVNLSVI